jgi:translation initiation factor IF-2
MSAISKKTEKKTTVAPNVTKTVPKTLRPPVVVVMGHIDHGKSTLLDYIRKTNIVAGEAGGITQHMGAYEVVHNSNKITFIDTPGHEAFSSIRERGAQVADIAILVVSAEDGVKPQTLEALACIKEAKLPYVVAINKIDKPGANIERTKQNLAENEIYLEGYGGDISFVPISALTGAGVPDLLDMIMLIAEVGEFTAHHDVPAEGVVVEAHLDNKKGISATLIIKNGSLKTGMYVVAEDTYSPVRILEDFQGKPLKEATFSSPVGIIGFSALPPVGAPFVTVTSKTEAEELATKHRAFVRAGEDKNGRPATFPDTANKILVPLIIKADVVGSLDGVKHELAKIKNEKVAIKIVSEGVGAVSEADVKTAQSDPSIIILAFNAKPDSKAKRILENSGSGNTGSAPVQLKEFAIIYELIEYVKELVLVKVPKEYIDQSTGKAKILAIFSKAKDKQIVGGKVQEGSILQGSEVKILRRDIEIGRGRVRELQQQKVRTDEVREGYEFGTMIESKIEIALGDKIEGFKTVEKSSENK